MGLETILAQLDEEMSRNNILGKSAGYISGLVDYADLEEYINLQKNNIKEQYSHSKFYIDSDYNHKYEAYFNLIDDIENGSLREVIIYSPFIFEANYKLAEKLISVMEKNNCSLKIITLEDSYIKNFALKHFYKGDLHPYKTRTEIGAKKLINYSTELL